MESLNKQNRRAFLMLSGKAALATGMAGMILPVMAGTTGTDKPATQVMETEITPGKINIPYTQQPLPYDFKALEPAIDARTMEVHYTKHAATYAEKLKEAVQKENVNTSQTSLESLLGKISQYSPAMRNNAGGHFNHELFWKSLRPASKNNKANGKILEAIEKEFSSFDSFKDAFSTAAKDRFGSGWAWLMKTKEGKLVITSTPNQDNPLMDVAEVKGTPILGLDVWEHAYYLKYQNKRPDYIKAWWEVINWDFINTVFEG